MANISVKFAHTDIDTSTGEGYYSVRATATAAKGMPKNIFVLQVSSKDTKGNAVATFSHIASPSDIAMYPEDNPGDCPYYRVSDIKLILTSAQWRDSVESTIKADIQFLVDSYNAMSDSSTEADIVVFS